MLPIPVEVERNAIPEDLRKAVEALNGARPVEFSMTFTLAWLVIFAAIAAAEWIDAWWATLLAVIIIGTRMNILALLVHDQVHLAGYRHRYGDLLTNLFCAYPLILLTVEGYAQVHLAHHRYFFTPDDPDHRRKSGPEWAFPKTKLELLRIVLRDITGLNVIALARGKRVEKPDEQFVRRGVSPKWARPLFLVTVTAILIGTGTWKLALLYWVLPLLTVMQLIVRWGAICEHEYNREGASVVETTPLIETKWWEKIVLPNLNFTLHIYHHYFPGVAFSVLPKVHRMFKDAGLVKEDAVFKGYGDFFRRCVLKPSGVA
jgi:fatty acid desaturase